MKRNKMEMGVNLELKPESTLLEPDKTALQASQLLEAFGQSPAFAQVLNLGQQFLHPQFSPEMAASLALEFAKIAQEGPSLFPKVDFWRHNSLAPHFAPLLELLHQNPFPLTEGLPWPATSLTMEKLRFGLLAARFYAQYSLKMDWEANLPTLLLQPPALALEPLLQETLFPKKTKGKKDLRPIVCADRQFAYVLFSSRYNGF
ncbi:MAG: hypothetical protein HC913_01560 [Microscillaceae bacterium]|nr:hypothetical protein [Microscillaceae bacterium]